MNKCQNCGTEFESAFCPNCGAKSPETTEQSSENQELNPKKTAEYYEALKKIESEKKEKKNKLIRYSIPIIILVVLIIIGIFKISNSLKPTPKEEETTLKIVAQEINFNDVYNEFNKNSASASEKYDGKRYILYYTPYEIYEEGWCRGNLYDSQKNEWKDGEDSGNAYFDDKTKELIKGKTYKIEGTFDVDEHSYFLGYSIKNIEIIQIESDF